MYGSIIIMLENIAEKGFSNSISGKASDLFECGKIF